MYEKTIGLKWELIRAMSNRPTLIHILYRAMLDYDKMKREFMEKTAQELYLMELERDFEYKLFSKSKRNKFWDFVPKI